MSTSPARRGALRVLARVRRDAAFAGPVLAAELDAGALTAEDRSLVTRLVYGVLSTAGVLDDVIDAHVRGALEPRVRDALRIGAYEALYGAEPAYAVVDQTVTLVRTLRPAAAGLANAVMRRIAESAASFPWGDPDSDADALARVCGSPRWIVDEFVSALGREAAREALEAGIAPAPAFVRFEPFSHPREDACAALAPFSPEPVPVDPDCFLLGRAAGSVAAGRTGGWFPMDAGAQVAPAACRPAPGDRILDAAAGRGNKTVCLQGLAARGGRMAQVTAMDVHGFKVDRLRRRLEESQVPGVECEVLDIGDAPAAFGADVFDTVLLDAPCTGLGTLRRYPEKRWRLAPDDPERMAVVQSGLLRACARMVKAGGTVVYSTCSVVPVENDAVVSAFLESADGAGFVVEGLRDAVPEAWSRFIDDRGCFASWPTTDGPDGHYVARLRRTGS